MQTLLSKISDAQMVTECYHKCDMNAILVNLKGTIDDLNHIYNYYQFLIKWSKEFKSVDMSLWNDVIDACEDEFRKLFPNEFTDVDSLSELLDGL